MGNAHKYVYLFSEGNGSMRELLGGKGANLAEMTKIGLPVPQGFTITTEACNEFFTAGHKLPDGLLDEAWVALHKLEEHTDKTFGDTENPLLVSVRSGAAISMPGMMDTVLNLGLNDVTVKGFAKLTGDERFALDCYRRFIQMFSDVVMELPKPEFEKIIDQKKEEKGVTQDTELDTEDMKDLVKRFKAFYKENKGEDFPSDPKVQLMEAVKAGKINCIIVKDLSRFGRDYIDAGKYIEKIFPQLGVRFIAVNDHIDTLNYSTGDSLIVPVKNFLNDSYSRDISIKVRSNFESRRRNGEFVSNYTAYGYLRDPNDKTKLIVDEVAGGIVREIFRWKIEGMSPGTIAEKLNARGVLAPSEYKRSIGIKFKTSFQSGARSKWVAASVKRILNNEVYTGVLIQGRPPAIK